MPAFQLGPCAAALVSDAGQPSVTIVQVAGPGVLVCGRPAVEQLLRACQLALEAFSEQEKEGGQE